MDECAVVVVGLVVSGFVSVMVMFLSRIYEIMKYI